MCFTRDLVCNGGVDGEDVDGEDHDENRSNCGRTDGVRRRAGGRGEPKINVIGGCIYEGMPSGAQFEAMQRDHQARRSALVGWWLGRVRGAQASERNASAVIREPHIGGDPVATPAPVHGRFALEWGTSGRPGV